MEVDRGMLHWPEVIVLAAGDSSRSGHIPRAGMVEVEMLWLG